MEQMLREYKSNIKQMPAGLLPNTTYQKRLKTDQMQAPSCMQCCFSCWASVADGGPT